MLLLAGLSAGLLAAPAAQAVLGEAAQTVHADQMRLQGTRRLSSTLQYQVHEIQQADGSVLRQFASPSGQVFALSWRSRLKPQLQPLLGSYFGAYRGAVQAAGAARPGFSRQVSVAQEGLVLRETEHLGLFIGLAYVPALVPAGVDANALR